MRARTNFYFYLSRVSWAFYIIALFFAACALFTGLLALCTRLGSVLSGLNAFMAMASQAVAAALMTYVALSKTNDSSYHVTDIPNSAWSVKARNAFRANGNSSNLSAYGYGFSWAIFACYFLAMIFFCCGGGGRKKKNTNHDHEDAEATEVGAVNEPGTGYFGRSGSQRVSGNGGVKDEYS